MIVEISIHSFSLWHHFANKVDFDAIDFANLARSMGYQGISLSLNDINYRHLRSGMEDMSCLNGWRKGGGGGDEGGADERAC